MGWGAGDEQKRDLAKIKLSLAKAKYYELLQVVKELTHDEKRNALLAELDKIDDSFTRIESHLYR